MKVIVGSENPVKLEAAKKAFSHYFKDVIVTGIKAESGVSDLPLSEEETIRGATNRANACYNGNADFYVGVEDGVSDIPEGMFLVGWAAVMDGKKDLGLGSSARLQVPNSLAQKLRKGSDLNPFFEKAAKTKNIGQGKGVIGIATKGIINRTQFHEAAIVCALSRFLNEEMYR